MMLAECCRCQDVRQKVIPSCDDRPEIRGGPARPQSSKSNRRNNEDVQNLNGVLSLLWPTISAYIVRTLADAFGPAVRDILPKGSRQDFQIDISSSIVGEEPAGFRQKSERNPSTRNDEIVGASSHVTTFDLLGDISIYFKISSEHLGIDGICVKGALVVDVVQSSCDFGMPLSAQCLRFFFLDRPEVNLESLRPALMAANAQLTTKICDAIAVAIDRFMVLPNIIAFPLTADIDIFEAKSQRYCGVIHVHVRSGDDAPSTVTLVGAVKGKEEQEHNTGSPIKQAALSLFGLACNTGRETAPKDDYGLTTKGQHALPETGLEIRCGSDVGPSSNAQAAFTASFTFNTSFLICDVKRQRVSINLWEDRHMPKSSLGSLELPVADMSTWGMTEMTVILPEESKKAQHCNRQLKLAAAWRETISIPSELVSYTSSSSVWLLSVGVYGSLGLPRYGEDTLHWILAECDHIALQDVVSLTKVSYSIAEDGPSSKPKPMSTEACCGALKRKLSILQRNGLSAASIARVLEVDDELLAFENTGDLMAHPGLGTQDLRWEHLFCFVVAHPAKAELTLKLMRKSPGKEIIETDKYTCPLASLVSAENHHLVQVAALKETGALLELQLELKPLGKPEGCLISM